MKRANDTYQAVVKSSKQLLKFLLSTPLLLPIGFAYIIILIVFVSIIISLGAAILTSIVAIAIVLIDMLQSGLGQIEIIAFIGAALIGFSLMTFIFIWISNASLYISKELIELFSKLAKKKEKNNESI
jgi:uncharacterized membrane protein